MCQLAQITIPELRLLTHKCAEIVPAGRAGVMAIGKDNAYRIIADWFERGDLHVTLAANDLPLIGSVPLYLRAGRFHTKVFRRKAETLAGIEGHGKQGLRLVQAQFNRPGAHLPVRSSSESSR